MSDQPVRLTAPPEGYADWLADVKARIQSARQRATLAVNRELVSLYWQIGRDILVRQTGQGWGAKVIDRLSRDLRSAFPEMKVFSPRNLKYMRAFAEAWPDPAIVQEVLAQLPGYHQLALLDKLPGPETRRWYAAKAIEHNWSRNVLVMQIERELAGRADQSLTTRDHRGPQRFSCCLENFDFHGFRVNPRFMATASKIGFLLLTRSRAKPNTAKRLHNPAQGCEERATLGQMCKPRNTPTGLCHAGDCDTTPLGLVVWLIGILPG